MISIPLLSRQEVQEDEELGFCFTALYCTGYPDPYKAFESFTKEVAFKDYLHTLSKAMRNLLLMYLGSCIDRSKYSLENLVNLMSRNPQETIEIMHSITQAIGQEYKQQGIQEGMQQGRQEGMQQGIQQGMQQGRQEGMQQEKLHIAKNMLYQLHLDMTAVSKATGLSIAEIIKLQKVAKG